MSSSKIAGLGGAGFFVCVLVENLLRRGQPANDADWPSVLAWYRSSGASITVSEGLFVAAIPCLIAFGVGTYFTLRAHERAAPWALAGALSLTLMTPLLAGAMAVDIVLDANASRLAVHSETGRVLWALKASFFTLTAPVLATGLFTMAMATKAAAIGSRWVSTLAQLGSLAGFVSVLAPRFVVEGSALQWLSFAMFACWMLFLLVTSLSMLRNPATNGSSPSSELAGSPG